MEIVDKICGIFLAVLAVLNSYKIVLLIIGAICRAKTYAKTDTVKKYAVVIAARNEEAVIPKLLDSIAAQDYPQSLTVFVVADNCSDGTASACREKGAVVYERFDTEHVRKGYAMEFLFEHIAADYGIDSFDGYFVFDADNLLAPDFVSRMNEAFCAGNRVVTGYRNTKNFETNVISGGYGIHFLCNTLTMHRPRNLLGFGTHLTGTGYVIDSALLVDGWHFTTFTEDDQITLRLAGKGIKVAYCEAAEFFDEQPCDWKTVFRQRVRCAKGRLISFFRYGGKAFSGIFTHRSFTCYDMFCHYFPYTLVKWLIGLVYPVCSIVYALIDKSSYNINTMLVTLAVGIAVQYIYCAGTGLLSVMRERGHIRCSTGKAVFYAFTYPWFVFITIPVILVAVFTKVKWTPIVHKDSRAIDELVK